MLGSIFFLILAKFHFNSPPATITQGYNQVTFKLILISIMINLPIQSLSIYSQVASTQVLK